MIRFVNVVRSILVPGLILAAIGLSPMTASTILAEEISHTFTFDHPTVSQVVIEGDRYDRVVLPNAPNEGVPGEPALPASGGHILLPPNSRVTAVRAETAKPILLGDNFSIEPAQFPYILSGDPVKIVPAAPDKAVYERNALFPDGPVESIGTFAFRGYDFEVVSLSPVAYNPVTGELWFFPQITVTVETEDAVKSASLFRGLPADADEAASRFDNVDHIDDYHSLAKSGMDTYDLLIITSQDMKPAFAALESFHNSRGMLTQINTTADIGSNDPGDVRDYIRDAYMNDGIEYVLLGGDDDILPARGLYGAVNTGDGLEQDSSIPSDLYFGCLDGPFDYNGNGVYGEYGDGGPNNQSVDLVAEVHVGRAAVSNIGEAQRFVSKTIRYLTTQDTYLKKSLLLGEYLGFGGVADYGGNMMDQLVQYCEDDDYTTYGMPEETFTFDRLYDRDYAGNDWPNTKLFEKINENVHIINHDGHSNTSYALKTASTEAVENMKNDHLFLLYSQGCYAGAFDLGDCWTEHITIKTDNGAFAAFTNGRFGWGRGYTTDGTSQRFQRQFWDAIYNPDENKPELGRANSDSKEDNLSSSSSGAMRWVYYEMNLFGDPTVRLWNKWLGLFAFEFSDVRGDNDGVYEAGETIELRCDIENIGITSADNVAMELTISDASIGTVVSNAAIGSIAEGEIKTNDANPFVFTIPADYVTRVDTFYIDISWEEEGVAHEATLVFSSPVGAVPVLLVDGNEHDDRELYFLEYFNDNNLPYHLWESELSDGPMASDLNKYDIVIWFTGDFQTNPLTQNNIDAMRGFLDNGGNLFLTGQGIAASVNIMDQDFLHTYLKTQYESAQTWPLLTGFTGGTVFSVSDTIGIQGSGGAYNQTFPDRITVINGGAPEFKWLGTEYFGGVSYNGSYKLVYFTFGYEAIVNGNDRWTERDVVMDRILDFFNLQYADDAPQVTDMSIEPSDLTHMTDPAPIIRWQYSDPNGYPQTGYQVQAGADFFWSPDDRWDSGSISGAATELTYAGAELEDGHDYCLRVRVQNGQLWSDWSYMMVHYNSIPVPTELSPAGGETAYLGHIKLEYNTDDDIEGDALTYSYELYADEALTELVEQVDNAPGGPDKVSWPVSAELTVGEDYYWRARTHDGLEYSDWSATAMFIVGPEYVCGDANGDSAVNIGDAVGIINYVFKGGPAPDPIASGDANCDGACNIGDGVYLISHIFSGGDAPCANCPD